MVSNDGPKNGTGVLGLLEKWLVSGSLSARESGHPPAQLHDQGMDNSLQGRNVIEFSASYADYKE